MRKKFISSPDNRPTNLGGRDAIFHEGNEDTRGVATRTLDLGSDPQPCFNHCAVLMYIYLFLVASERFEVLGT